MTLLSPIFWRERARSFLIFLMQPFRPLMDRAIKNAFALKTFQEEDFTVSQQAYSIAIQKRRTFTKFFAQTLLEEKEAIFLYIQSYYRAVIRDKPLSDYPFYQQSTHTVLPFSDSL